MDSTSTPSNSSPGMRTLAAIVFTDIVGFSARMQKDEVGTLKLLKRDFDEMGRLCREHGGTVLKSTGDGLLLTFSSAVHAVACALAMQRQFAEEAKAKPTALQHRVGIHLGDMFYQNQDVMGDGVNIASRLQAEAEPGGICISQTVYDVVKNKLEMQAVSLGPRDLKNISQAIPVYRILLEASALAAGSSRQPMPQPASPPKQGVRRPLGLWIAAGAGVAAAAAAGVYFVVRPAPPEPAAASTAPKAGEVSSNSTSAAAANPAGAAAADATGGGAIEMSDAEFERELARRQAQMQQARTQYLEKYDFAAFAKALRENPDSAQGRANAQLMLRSADQMVAMKEAVDFALTRYRAQQQLVVPDLGGDATKDFRVFPVIGNKLVVVENNAPTPARSWSELKPPMAGAIIVSALRNARQPAATREQILGAQAFGRFFNLPTMIEPVNAMLRTTAGRQGPNAARQGQVPAPRAGRQ